LAVISKISLESGSISYTLTGMEIGYGGLVSTATRDLDRSSPYGPMPPRQPESLIAHGLLVPDHAMIPNQQPPGGH
jgi:hypothetical protein